MSLRCGHSAPLVARHRRHAASAHRRQHPHGGCLVAAPCVFVWTKSIIPLQLHILRGGQDCPITQAGRSGATDQMQHVGGLPLLAAPCRSRRLGRWSHEADAVTDRGSADPQLYIFGHLGRLKRAGAPGPASAGGRPTTSALSALNLLLRVTRWTNSARSVARGAGRWVGGWVGGLAAAAGAAPAIPSRFGGCYLHRTLLLHLGLRARLKCSIMQVQLRLLLGQARLWQGNAP